MGSRLVNESRLPNSRMCAARGTWSSPKSLTSEFYQVPRAEEKSSVMNCRVSRIEADEISHS